MTGGRVSYPAFPQQDPRLSLALCDLNELPYRAKIYDEGHYPIWCVVDDVVDDTTGLSTTTIFCLRLLAQPTVKVDSSPNIVLTAQLDLGSFL